MEYAAADHALTTASFIYHQSRMNGAMDTEVHSMDEIIALYKKDVDRTLLRENLNRSPTERVLNLMQLQRVHEEFRRAGQQLRRKPNAAAES